MSLAIDVDGVISVMIAGIWMDVLDGSFFIDSYEYVWEAGKDMTLLGGGNDPLITSYGFSFIPADGSGSVGGPLTSIQAVRYGAS